MMNQLFLVFMSFSLLGLAGCGSSVTVAPVSGKVLCQGKPIKDASIVFSPIGKEGEKEPGKAAGGSVDGNGDFFLGTYTANDGAILGMHRVVISYNNPYEAHVCTPANDLVLEVKTGNNVFTIELDAKFKN